MWRWVSTSCGRERSRPYSSRQQQQWCCNGKKWSDMHGITRKMLVKTHLIMEKQMQKLSWDVFVWSGLTWFDLKWANGIIQLKTKSALVKFKSSKINPDRTNRYIHVQFGVAWIAQHRGYLVHLPAGQSGNVYILHGLWCLRRKVIIALYMHSHIHFLFGGAYPIKPA